MKDRQKIQQFVVNYHINEICNFKCGYCYADWGLKANRNDVFRHPHLRESVISQLWSLLAPYASNSQVATNLAWDRVRLNIAGGEPLLYEKEVLAGIKQARALGFDLSIITNGSRLTAELARQLAPDLEWLGISIDSLNPITNAEIGRRDKQNRQVTLEGLQEAISAAKATNPNIKIKLNTVVNAHNFTEDLSPLIEAIKPEKWKIFRALPATTDALLVSNQGFFNFVGRHARFDHCMRVENNDTMLSSYLMVDPLGRFFDNSTSLKSKTYVYSDPIHKVGAHKAFSQISFDAHAFNARYLADKPKAERLV